MMNILDFYEAGKARSGTALIPINGSAINLYFSTRNGNGVVDWGDGTTSNWTTPKYSDATLIAIDNTSHSYSANYNGNIAVKFLQGLKDVYSFTTTVNSTSQKLNIIDFGAFINQFPNLYSIKLLSYAYNVYADMGVIKGDLGNIPASVERYVCESFEVKDNATDVWFNFSSLPVNSKLKFIDFSGEVGIGTRRKIIGDLGNLPVGCYFCKFSRADNSSINYTAGKVWASSFDTLTIPLQLSHIELENLLIDMNNSITTKIGNGVIAIGGYRSYLSDAAVASLQAKGFTVNVQRILNNVSNSDSALLRLDFQNNFDVYSNSGLNIATGGTSNQPTFALSGRKPGEYCAVFNGSQSIKTTTNLPVNSDKVTIAFWMKTDSSTAGIIGELSGDISSNNAFNAYLNVGNVKNLNITSRQSGFNQSRIDNNSLHGNAWNRIVIVIDRSLNASNEVLIYVNGSLATITKPVSTDNIGNFVNNIFFIGQRAGNTLGFVGSLMHYKIHNYPFTQAEVTADYNAFL